jgi:hypothetical protein
MLNLRAATVVAPRLAVRAVKGAPFAFTGTKRNPLTEEAHGLGAGFCQEGQIERRTMTEPNNRKGPGSAPGPNRVYSPKTQSKTFKHKSDTYE